MHIMHIIQFCYILYVFIFVYNRWDWQQQHRHTHTQQVGGVSIVSIGDVAGAASADAIDNGM